MKTRLILPLAVSAIVPLLFAVALAQNDAPKTDSKAADAKATDKADAKTAKTRAKPRGRLPAFYNQVIDGQQREKIYSIQQQYEPKITALKAELQALQQKVNGEVEAVLTPEQLAKVKSLAEEAKQKRQNATTTTTASTDENPDSDGDDGDDADDKTDAKADAAKASAKTGK
ncbi:MAG TPA: hypothetical protein VHC22_20790 [Pirellulales bacterium]|nr:hypothetical protein [Pirellulales bacterium]